MVEPHSSNFRVITTNFLGVRIFSKFTLPRSEFVCLFLFVFFLFFFFVIVFFFFFFFFFCLLVMKYAFAYILRTVSPFISNYRISAIFYRISA